MSLTTENTSGTKIGNPTKLYINFSGERGTFEYWDGASTQQLDQINFVVIDIRGSITGWNDSGGGRIYSNYFESTKEPVVLKCGAKGSAKELFSGSYANDKETIVSLGGKYQTNIFAIMVTPAEYIPVNIQLCSSALAAWSEYTKTLGYKGYYGKIITASKSEPKKKGRVVFHTPVFSNSPMTEEVLEVAKEYDSKYLQPYLNQFKTVEASN